MFLGSFPVQRTTCTGFATALLGNVEVKGKCPKPKKNTIVQTRQVGENTPKGTNNISCRKYRRVLGKERFSLNYPTTQKMVRGKKAGAVFLPV